MTSEQAVRDALAHVSFQNWTFHVDHEEGTTFIRVRFLVDGAEQHGRKWFVSPDATPSDIVRTAFMAVMTAVEHEAREHFAYKGWAIFGPHYDVETLVACCHEGRVA
ncbi:hypothetical protein MYSTI_01954 [Myxococcus stipitatus DSM 14675]|uniref:Uncharacterized protein n=1 Tax=Myxococcus stipitatus (strain DSM 14675 / JCM 12634 / Mx s8) TaxID=1278073 RepID=L7U574_MYXSD|nr:hypothetical protein [Myxococcus stipitatus]AGC43283.1 hypothetical protein MYSTI_01954 [Myxococcus stipitatus DSM 14675]